MFLRVKMQSRRAGGPDFRTDGKHPFFFLLCPEAGHCESEYEGFEAVIALVHKIFRFCVGGCVCGNFSVFLSQQLHLNTAINRQTDMRIGKATSRQSGLPRTIIICTPFRELYSSCLLADLNETSLFLLRPTNMSVRFFLF